MLSWIRDSVSHRETFQTQFKCIRFKYQTCRLKQKTFNSNIQVTNVPLWSQLNLCALCRSRLTGDPISTRLPRECQALSRRHRGCPVRRGMVSNVLGLYSPCVRSTLPGMIIKTVSPIMPKASWGANTPPAEGRWARSRRSNVTYSSCSVKLQCPLPFLPFTCSTLFEAFLFCQLDKRKLPCSPSAPHDRQSQKQSDEF